MASWNTLFLCYSKAFYAFESFALKLNTVSRSPLSKFEVCRTPCRVLLCCWLSRFNARNWRYFEHVDKSLKCTAFFFQEVWMMHLWGSWVVGAPNPVSVWRIPAENEECGPRYLTVPDWAVVGDSRIIKWVGGINVLSTPTWFHPSVINRSATG